MSTLNSCEDAKYHSRSCVVIRVCGGVVGEAGVGWVSNIVDAGIWVCSFFYFRLKVYVCGGGGGGVEPAG